MGAYQTSTRATRRATPPGRRPRPCLLVTLDEPPVVRIACASYLELSRLELLRAGIEAAVRELLSEGLAA
jgi:hypothetical protein